MKIKVAASKLQWLWRAVVEINDARHDLTTSVRLSRMQAALAEWYGPWDERASELIVRHTGGRLSIQPGDDEHPAFVADPEVEEHWSQVIELDVEPVTMATLRKAEGLRVSPVALDALREAGLVTDDEKKPTPKKSTRSRRKKS